jgi:phosphoglycolate phosphatase
MKYQLILWDFDGTLADTLGRALEIYNALAGKHGFRPVEDPATVRGLSMRAFLRQHGISLPKLPGLVREFLAAQRQEMAQTRLFPGLVPVLHELSRRELGLGVLSSNAPENISTCLRANNVVDLFETVVGYRRLFGKGKGLRRFVRGQQGAGRAILYVGDEVRDIDAARRAGVPIAAVTWGMNTRELLDRHQPD